MPQIKYICLLAILCLNAACSRHALHDVQVVVAQADSLWHAGQMYGIDQGDSSTLAQAYETLGQFGKLSIVNSQLSTAYAHACYHYGRLLRKKDDPVSAMQVFIHATHSHTRDYHILGRIYSNMGELCHLAGDFPLSYDMYEKSGEMYLRNGDTLLYYYDINNMAFELADMADTTRCLSVLRQLEGVSELNYNVWKTKAEMYLKAKKYNSALKCVEHIGGLGYHETGNMLIKAQAFDALKQKDSALIYANLVLEDTCTSFQNRFNALYIVSHNDSSLSAEDILTYTSQREDIRYYEYEPLMKKIAQSISLLKRDIKKYYYLKRIAIPILLVIFLILVFIIYNIHNNINKRSAFLLEKKTTLQEFEQREKELDNKQDILEYNNKIFDEKKLFLRKEIENRCKLLHDEKDLKNKLHWKIYEEMRNEIDQYFYLFASKLQQVPSINERDVRLCVLVLIDLSHAQIAQLMFVEENSVGKLKERTAKKLNSSRKNMRQNLLNVIIGDY